jgi:hypothetical protein
VFSFESSIPSYWITLHPNPQDHNIKIIECTNRGEFSTKQLRIKSAEITPARRDDFDVYICTSARSGRSGRRGRNSLKPKTKKTCDVLYHAPPRAGGGGGGGAGGGGAGGGGGPPPPDWA